MKYPMRVCQIFLDTEEGRRLLHWTAMELICQPFGLVSKIEGDQLYSGKKWLIFIVATIVCNVLIYIYINVP